MLPLLGAGLGVLQGLQQQRAARQQNKAAAAQTAGSPWTGMGAGQTTQGPGMAGILGGGLQGAMGGMEAARKQEMEDALMKKPANQLQELDQAGLLSKNKSYLNMG